MSKALPISALLEAMAEQLSTVDVVSTAVKAKISSQIEKWRVSHGMTQAEFAEFMGVSQSQVSKWEKGACNFSVEKLSEIACRLDLRLDVSLLSEAEFVPLQESVDIGSEMNSVSNIIYMHPPISKQLTASASTDLMYGNQQICVLDFAEG